MNQPDTQEVTTSVDMSREALMSVLVPHQAAPQGKPRTEAPAAPVAEPAPTPAVPEQPATPVAEVAATVVPEAPDPYASVIEAAMPQQTTAPAWTPEATAAFKHDFGVEDPKAYKQSVEEKLTAAELLKAEYDKALPLVTALNSMPPAVQKAFALAMEGKVEEAQAFIRETPSGVLANKEAKDIPTRNLVDTHFPGKIKPEQWAMLDDPEADADMVEALKARVQLLHETAAEKHDKQREGIVQSRAQQEAAQKAAYDNYKQATASTISLAKSSPLGKLVDPGTVEQLTSGQFLSLFVQPDGVSPTPEAGTRYLWALHGEKLMQAAETRGYQRGKMEGSLETTSRQPGVPQPQRTNGDAPKNQTEEDRVRQLLFGALRS